MITINHSMTNGILVDFDAVVDYKIGIINLFKCIKLKKNINREYVFTHNMDFFKIEHIYSVEDIIRKSLSENNKDFYKKLTKEFISGEYEYDIYQISPLTLVSRLIRTYKNTDGMIEFDVLCYSKNQERIIHEKIGKDIPTIVTTRESIDLNKYGRIILGYIEYIKDFTDVTMKDILVVNFRENFEENNEKVLKSDYFLPYILNKFSVVDSYNDYKNPIG